MPSSISGKAGSEIRQWAVPANRRPPKHARFGFFPSPRRTVRRSGKRRSSRWGAWAQSVSGSAASSRIDYHGDSAERDDPRLGDRHGGARATAGSRESAGFCAAAIRRATPAGSAARLPRTPRLPPQRVHGLGALLDQQALRPVQRQQRLHVQLLHRREPHARPLRRFADRPAAPGLSSANAR